MNKSKSEVKPVTRRTKIKEIEWYKMNPDDPNLLQALDFILTILYTYHYPIYVPIMRESSKGLGYVEVHLCNLEESKVDPRNTESFHMQELHLEDPVDCIKNIRKFFSDSIYKLDPEIDNTTFFPYPLIDKNELILLSDRERFETIKGYLVQCSTLFLYNFYFNSEDVTCIIESHTEAELKRRKNDS